MGTINRQRERVGYKTVVQHYPNFVKEKHILTGKTLAGRIEAEMLTVLITGYDFFFYSLYFSIFSKVTFITFTDKTTSITLKERK